MKSRERLLYNWNGYSAVLTLRNNEYQVDTQITWKPRQSINADYPFVFFNCRMDTIEDEQIFLRSKDEFSIISAQTENGLCEVQYNERQCSSQHQIEVSANVKMIHESLHTNKDTIIFITDHPLQPQIRIDAHFLLPLRE